MTKQNAAVVMRRPFYRYGDQRGKISGFDDSFGLEYAVYLKLQDNDLEFLGAWSFLLRLDK